MRPLPNLAARDRSLGEFLASNEHAFTRADVISGWSRRSLESALRRGDAIRILPGVYAGARYAGTPRVRGEALNLWQPGALVTGRLAVHLYDASLAPGHDAQIRVPNGHRPRAPEWVHVVQGDRQSAWGYAHGVACAVAEIAVLDMWRAAAPAERLDLLWRALWAKVCAANALSAALTRTPRIPARRDLQRVLAWFADGATSPLEVRAKHETFADARFRDFAWQVPLILRERRAVVDMLHMRAKVAVELDGDRYHSTRDARDADRARQAELAAAGYTVLRFGWNDIVRRPDWCRELVLATVATRLALPSGT
ncbi:type IV toxin-antitoxin system AbiEi family antitoxin domain-containing protein [Demequina litorisediminis]|nr:type IV toxin-antitoxin system AbiEi family antitoxin domain-containing protein [Demequina litorisediminis]